MGCVCMDGYVCVCVAAGAAEAAESAAQKASKQQAYVQLTVTTQTSRKRSLEYESQFPNTLHTVDTCHT